MKRPSWDEWFMMLAETATTRSTCLRRQVGATLAKDSQVLSIGYNGPPRHCSHCVECLREKNNIPSGEKQEVCKAAHAEQNVICQAARHGVRVMGATLYTTLSPCTICAKMIINAGIVRIVYKEGYPDKLGLQMLEEAGIKLDKLKV